MIDRFLSLFQQHCSALADATMWQENYKDAHADKLRIQDHNNWLTGELERTREELRAARHDKDESLKMLANVGWQQKNGWVPWPESGRLPQEYVTNETPGPLKPDHVMGHDAVRQQNAAVLQEWIRPGSHPELRAKKG